ncbi:hypothetical protein AB6A40_004820 [Gnathostoma spinigerum]|uniref:Reverse transcriptase domain-containing protein n=1 Tax=Gnathostoma spinigerum TaxID=75299 RepID=A0ABD6EEN7_9BILA
MKIVKAYAPTSTRDDDELEDIYNELDNILEKKSTYTIVMGDFNAKIGRGKEGEKYIGRQGIGKRNERGERMAMMVETKKLYVGNSWFRKNAKRRWTWIAPNAAKKNEIDYILVDTRRILKDVAVVPSFNIDSDHRLLCARISIDIEVENRILRLQRRHRHHEIVTKRLQNEVEKADWSMLEDIDHDYAKLISTLQRCTKAAEVCHSRKESRLSRETKELLEKRRMMRRHPHNNAEFNILSKLIRRKMREDLENYRNRRLMEAAEKRLSIKKGKRSLLMWRDMITAMKNEDGQRETRREEINEICKRFYSNLFQSCMTISPPNLLEDLDPPPSVLISEVRNALKEMPTGKIPGKDDISVEVLYAGGYTLWRALAKQFTAYMAQCKVPSDWKSSKTILLYKKGDREDFKNYRPICLLSTIYKLFTKIISNRLSRTFDEQQPREQAGLRGGYSTIDNIFVLNHLLQKSIEHNLPLCLVFVDYEKAFDSVETNAVFNALKQQDNYINVIENNYIKLLAELNNGCSTEITLFHSPL